MYKVAFTLMLLVGTPHNLFDIDYWCLRTIVVTIIIGVYMYMPLLLFHEQFSKIFIGHLVLGLHTASFFLLPSNLACHHSREQGDLCLTLVGTVKGKRGREEGQR